MSPERALAIASFVIVAGTSAYLIWQEREADRTYQDDRSVWHAIIEGERLPSIPETAVWA